MQITIFSVWMTVLWSSILIAIFYALRIRMILPELCSVPGVIVLYLFCLVRMLVPIEFSWTKVIAAPEICNRIYDVLRLKINIGIELYVYQFAVLVWLMGAVLRMLLMLGQYRKAVRYFDGLALVENGIAIKVARRIAGEKIPDIVQTSAVRSPCCIGFFRKRILIPEKSFSEMELYYIILHEYIHLQNNDFVTKILINMLCAFYWWNPFVYLLKKDLNQSLEIRCDSMVVQRLGRQERSDYLSVILKEFINSQGLTECKNQRGAMAQLFENHSDQLVERFRLVADDGRCRMGKGKLYAWLMTAGLFVASYSFVMQTQYDVPQAEIETDQDTYEVISESSYIIRQDDENYIFHSRNKDIPLEDDSVRKLMQDGFSIIERGEEQDL